MTLRSALLALVVEDDPANAELIEHRLRSLDSSMFPPRVRVIIATSVAAACEILRGTEPELILLDLLLPDARGLEALSQVRALTGAPIIVMTNVVDQRLGVRALHAGAQDVIEKPIPEGHALGRLLLFAIERRRADEQRDTYVAKARRSIASRERSTSIVAHDLRNPLNTVRICASALRDPEPAPLESVREMARLIDQAAAWMQQLVQDLLDRASIDAGRLVMQRRAVEVGPLLEKARSLLSPVAQRQGVTFTVHDAPELAPVFADPRRLLQVLSNLVGSALAMTPPGGTIILSAHAAVRTSEDERRGTYRGVRFDVSDTGSGMPVEHLANLYDWAWQGADGAESPWGLGLAIAKGLVEAHGSQLHVSSVQGCGTSFSFVIAPEGQPSPDVFVLSGQ
jgi:signal transduction histidine kinase